MMRKNDYKINGIYGIEPRRLWGAEPRSLWGDLSNLFFIFFILAVIIMLAFSQFYTGANVKGPSMMPLFNKDYLESPEKEDVAYYCAVDSYDYNDIVIAHVIENGVEKNIVKRVVGLPGDYIEIKKCEDGYYYLYRNAIKVDEPYIYSKDGMKFSNIWFDAITNGKGHLTVGASELFILGDNRGDSKDSTYYGCFKYDQILGVVEYAVEADESPILSIFLQLFFPVFKQGIEV